MKGFRSSLLILLSLLLLISVVLLGTVFYHFYYKQPAYKPVLELTSKDKIVITNDTRDSLQKRYDATLQKLDNKLDTAFNNADSLNTSLDIRLTEFYKLRQEIAAILKDKSSSADLDKASQKITELQVKISALNSINKNVERENTRLNAIIEQLRSTPAATEQTGISPVRANKPGKEKKSFIKPSTITDLNFAAIRINDDKEEETSAADETIKLTGSFTIKNTELNGPAELMIVIMKPGGRILQGSSWDVGTFETPQGKRIYSRKMNIEYRRGENKKLQFAVPADELEKGEYTMQVYQNGNLIGRTMKALN